MPMDRTQFPQLFELSVDPNVQTKLSMLEELTDYAFDEAPPEYEDIFRVSDGDGTGESDTGIGQLGLPQEQDGEFGDLHYDVQGRWFAQNYVFTDFNLAYLISHQLQRDDKWGMAGIRAKAFGRSFRRLPEVMAARMFNEGFSATTQQGIANLGRRSPDSQPLFSTAHPNPGPGGGTQANKPASGGADLAHSSVEAMMVRMGLRTDDRGMPIQGHMRLLYGPWQLYPRMLEILNSQMRTDTLNRVKNVLPTVFPVTPKYSRYLTNVRAYFGIGNKDQIGLRFIWRERPSRDMWKERGTRGIHVAGWCSYDYGWSHTYGVDGDPGLGG